MSGPGLCQWLIKSIPSKIKQIQFQIPLYIPWRARLEPHSKPAYLGPKCLTFYFPCLPCLTCNHDLHPPETTGRSFLQFHLSVRVCMYLCLPHWMGALPWSPSFPIPHWLRRTCPIFSILWSDFFLFNSIVLTIDDI